MQRPSAYDVMMKTLSRPGARAAHAKREREREERERERQRERERERERERGEENCRFWHIEIKLEFPPIIYGPGPIYWRISGRK